MTAPATWYAIQGPNGDLTWRVESPAKAIGAKTVLIPEDEGDINAWDALYYPNLDSKYPWVLEAEVDGETTRITSKQQFKTLAAERKSLADSRIDHLAQEGEAAVFTRPLAFFAAHMLEMRRQGIRVVAECDDNYIADSRLNIFLRKASKEENYRDNHIRSIAVGDGLILSTEYLRDLYWKGLKDEFGKENLPELFVCRNHIDEQYIPDVVHHDGPLRVGYMGSDSHLWDVELAYEALAAAHEAGCEIVFVGIHPAALNPSLRRASKKDWSQIPYTHIPWRTEGFRGAQLPLDIGLAPVLVDHYTLGKSDIKWMEYALSGAACVAQNCLVYNRTAKHGETALLAGSPAEFAQQTMALVRDAELRRRLVDNTMQYVREERLLWDNTQEWEEAVLGA